MFMRLRMSLSRVRFLSNRIFVYIAHSIFFVVRSLFCFWIVTTIFREHCAVCDCLSWLKAMSDRITNVEMNRLYRWLLCPFTHWLYLIEPIGAEQPLNYFPVNVPSVGNIVSLPAC